MTKQQYIDKYWLEAQAACAGTPIFPLLALAESAVESEWGESFLTKEANNLFGIKSTPSWEENGGAFVMKPTHEYKTSKEGADTPFVTRTIKNVVYYRYTIAAKFRKYDSARQALENYVHFITQPRYVAAGVTEAKTPEEQVICVAKAGYATAPDYAKVITDVMHGLSALLPVA